MTAATAIEAAMKASDGDKGDGEGYSGGGRATVEGRRQRAMARAARAAMATAMRVTGDEEDEGAEEGNESFYS